MAPGIHEVNQKITIDFDLEIEGAGPESIVQRGPDYTISANRTLFQIGNEFGKNNFIYGVKLSNFTYEGSDGDSSSSGGSPTIVISHNLANLNNSEIAAFFIDNVRFSTPSYGPGLGNNWVELISIGTPGNTGLLNPIFQNVSITNCYFKNFGSYIPASVLHGAVWCVNTDPSAQYKNIIVSNCIRDLTTFDTFTYIPNFLYVPSILATSVMEVNNVSIE